MPDLFAFMEKRRQADHARLDGDWNFRHYEGVCDVYSCAQRYDDHDQVIHLADGQFIWFYNEGRHRNASLGIDDFTDCHGAGKNDECEGAWR